MAGLCAPSGMPARQFSTVILAGSWPETDPRTCEILARTHHGKAQELLHSADEARAAADRVIASQSGSTVQAFHQTSYRLAATFTTHADRYFAMGRTSTECGRILAGLRADLDRIDARANDQISQLMRSATTGPSAMAARM